MFNSPNSFYLKQSSERPSFNSQNFNGYTSLIFLILIYWSSVVSFKGNDPDSFQRSKIGESSQNSNPSNEYFKAGLAADKPDIR